MIFIFDMKVKTVPSFLGIIGMGEDYVKETQNTLGKIIKKPPMTTKLLNKPPFRFLHDIIKEVIKETGFMVGLYPDADLDSNNVKDKESKIAFLQKAIDLVVLVTGQSLSVRPSKVVAGHEPEKTNEFLQAIAKACKAKEKKGSSDNRNRSSSRDKDSKRDRSREKNGEEEKSKDKESNLETETRRGAKTETGTRTEKGTKRGVRTDRRIKTEAETGQRMGQRTTTKRMEKGGAGMKKRKDQETKIRTGKNKRKLKCLFLGKKRKEETVETTKPPVQQNEIHNDDEGEDLRPVNGDSEDGVSSNRIPRPSSAKGQRRRPTKDGNSGDSEQKASTRHSKDERVNGEENGLATPPTRRPARPSSARPAPPRLKKQESTDKDESRVGSGKQVSNVIVDNAQNSEDEEESFVVEESQPLIDDGPGPMQSESIEDDGDHGGLVKKILETKKELEGTKNEQKEEKPVIMDAAHRKQRELVQREVEKLRGSIQTLTRSANPLGKIMDYLQEDVDSMQKELEMWKKENRDHELAIKREQSITDSELEPLRAQLSELDQSVVDQLDAIAMVKSNILRNDDKVKKMMGSVAFS
ncbi:putative TRAF3-interacting protein 1-like [Apostichopus japonicus]|uniref:TRAF3-interacting protein 1 n=1 Tax=Stichopus japonicus TaxID=307972 RepID=A0A2G8KE77_STIJA|nr:putative TRAF3-interacting protein 1-like [Apostichopus japonicus]